MDHKILGLLKYDLKFPLKKEDDKSISFLIPLLSARFSPTETKNMTNNDIRIDYNSIFSIDRIGNNEMVEGGKSITLGLEYSKKNKINNLDLIELKLANIIRDKKNYDLPNINSMDEKRSDIIGQINLYPSKFFDISYEFSADKNIEKSNYNLLKTNLRINNFVTSFEFLEEDNEIGEKSYLKNITKLNINEKNSLTFKTSEDLNNNITEYYNLIYEYKNDCLVASLEYDKQYYSDKALKPEQNLFFIIKILPFGALNTPSLTNEN